MMTNEEQVINRWRLILGKQSEQEMLFQGSEREVQNLEDMENLLEYLYEQAAGEDVRQGERKGGLGKSNLNAAKWITKVRKLFPKQTAEILEKQALEEFHMTELLTDKKVLEQIQPDMHLLKTILQLKHLMKGEVLETAKQIAQKVADQLREKLENSVRRSILGRIDRNSSSPVHSARNLDMKKTIRKNLKHYDPETKQLILQEIYFSNRVKNTALGM